MMIFCTNKDKIFCAPSVPPLRLRGYIHTHTPGRTLVKSVKTRRNLLVYKGLYLQTGENEYVTGETATAGLTKTCLLAKITFFVSCNVNAQQSREESHEKRS